MIKTREIVVTAKAPGAIGPYSQAVRVENLLYTSGQIAIDPESGQLIDGDIVAQTEQVMKNLGAILEAGGSSMASVIKTVIFLKDMNDFSTVNEIYGRYFKSNYPARSCVAVESLPKGARIEVEAVALIDSGSQPYIY
jgi:2-iminobutanoate/2-iminopropanoate deaminase